MNRLLDSDPLDESSTPDREISLGTPTILGIFFALALVCACFFGFGYTMGRKSVQSAGSPPGAVPGSVSSASMSSVKPAAGSLAGQPAAAAAKPAGDASQSPPVGRTVAVPIAPSSPPKDAATPDAATPADAIIAGDRLPTSKPQPATASLQPATSFVVQVAAVSSQEVADILLASLKKKGYSVAVHQEPQDKLLHVQIGPFADRQDAEAMRQRVLADGFNAIVK